MADFRRRVGEKQEERKKEQRGRHSAFYGLTASVAAATLILALSLHGGRGTDRGFFQSDYRPGIGHRARPCLRICGGGFDSGCNGDPGAGETLRGNPGAWGRTH